MDQQNSAAPAGVSATAAEPSTFNSESRVINTTNGETINSTNSTRVIQDVVDNNGEGSSSSSSSNNIRNGNGNQNEREGANLDETETRTDPNLRRRPQTLGDVMRELGSRAPDVMVLDSMPEESNSRNRETALNPREDLWISTADG